MVKNYLKCSASVIIREMQIEITVRYHVLRIAITTMITIIVLPQLECKKRKLMHCRLEFKLVSPL